MKTRPRATGKSRRPVQTVEVSLAVSEERCAAMAHALAVLAKHQCRYRHGEQDDHGHLQQFVQPEKVVRL